MNSNTIDIPVSEVRQRIAEQRRHIEHQREFIQDLEKHGLHKAAKAQTQQLEAMTSQLAQMKADMHAAEKKSAEPLDEESLEKVMRDCPM
jgi:septal ring factor EnvC (AmiA/AmiB activator)